ncbi:hypothetical protein DFH09DRAFT_1093491 [Mycena vulgaris]|nr:hypothetical protein DFH09DRAFT_1093491 [Mycena vulgaris]
MARKKICFCPILQLSKKSPSRASSHSFCSAEAHDGGGIRWTALLAKVSELTDLSAEMTRLCIAVQRVVPALALLRASLEMTRLCLDVQVFFALTHLEAKFPPLSARQQTLGTSATAAAAAGTLATNAAAPAAIDQSDWIWVRGVARTPTEARGCLSRGVGDELPWQVVCIGREPGLSASSLTLCSDDANEQITGIPNQFRQKKSTRLEALAFYCLHYNAGQGSIFTVLLRGG